MALTPFAFWFSKYYPAASDELVLFLTVVRLRDLRGVTNPPGCHPQHLVEERETRFIVRGTFCLGSRRSGNRAPTINLAAMAAKPTARDCGCFVGLPPRDSKWNCYETGFMPVRVVNHRESKVPVIVTFWPRSRAPFF